MRAVVQRCLSASVTIDGEVVGRIERGLVVLLGVEIGDTEVDAQALADKVIGLRIFDDPDGKMNLALEDVDGGMLIISQFTLLGDARKGKRPSFIRAASPQVGQSLYNYFVEFVKGRGVPQVATGRFGAEMQVALINQGPVTILLDSRKLF